MAGDPSSKENTAPPAAAASGPRVPFMPILVAAAAGESTAGCEPAAAASAAPPLIHVASSARAAPGASGSGAAAAAVASLALQLTEVRGDLAELGAELAVRGAEAEEVCASVADLKQV